MKIGYAVAMGRSVLRTGRALLGGRLRFPRNRLGDVLELADGTAFVVYRETARRAPAGDGADGVGAAEGEDAPDGDGAVLVFRFRVGDPAGGERLRDVLFDPLANVATPFFAGLPGFRRKLWLAGDRPGEFLELYEWASRADAERFADLLRALLAPFDPLGTASVEVVDDDAVDAYVAARELAWRDAGSREDGSRRRSALLAAALVVGAAVVVAGAAVAASLRRRRRGGRPPGDGE